MRLSEHQIAQTVQTLNRDGICVLRGVLDAALVRTLKAETETLMQTLPKGVAREGHPGGPSIRLTMARLSIRSAPTIVATLGAAELADIARRYDPRGSFCVDAVVTHDVNPGPVTDIHFDMKPSLKCMIYLTDVDRSCAAFRYAPGTHLANRSFRRQFLRAGGSLQHLPNVPAADEAIPLTDMEGAAGTVLMFDTDGWHSAGILSPGHERLLIRSRTILHGLFNDSLASKVARLPINPMRPPPPPIPAGRRSTGGTARAS